jgi:predicted type IV restriction endonuclease
MPTADEAIEELKKIREEFRSFCDFHGKVTEADTRANLIDRVLAVFAWPPIAIKREPHTDAGRLDYSLLVRNRPYVVVEAKREGEAFVFPIDAKQRTFRLRGAILTSPPIKDAIEQVHAYCVDQGIRYAIATNGYAWIIFRALREDLPWRDGTAIGFRSLDDILQNFTEAWNLLSFSAIEHGSLDAEFGPGVVVKRELHRVITYLFNADLPLQRNRLNSQLQPFIKRIFEDIAEQNEIAILERCYVHSASLRIATQDIGCVIRDSMPRLIEQSGGQEIKQGPRDSGAFGVLLSKSIEGTKGEMCLLLGGIGSGKSTFLKRYQRSVGKEVLDAFTFWFSVDFLAAPIDPAEMEKFVWSEILRQMRERYQAANLETRRNLKKAFAAEIAAISETALRGAPPGSREYENALTPYLIKWQENTSEYISKLLAICDPQKNRKVVIFIDNVDQLSATYQAQIFLLGQRVTRIVSSITIIALREESYYSPSVQKAFTAYTNYKFHIASPHFHWMLKSRIEYALDLLSARTSSLIS